MIWKAWIWAAGLELLAFLAAGAVETVVYYEVFANGGHPDVPFTQYPGYFFWAPVTPFILAYFFIVSRDPVYGYCSLVFVVSYLALRLIARKIILPRLPVRKLR